MIGGYTRRLGLALLLLLGGCSASPWRTSPPDAPLLTGERQLTFEGRRAGEGYFSADGRMLVFQSEREAGNPFFQIYLMDLETGDLRRVSPGHGKTTCGWIHPSGDRVLFASTHHDPESRAKQRVELEQRASGRDRRYEWDFDEHFELYSAALPGGELARLTDARGYDAEGSYSPDGEWIAFASNRHVYAGDEPPGDDPSQQMDIYLMRSDGSDLRRLTNTPGYDGGPFFSPDGVRIVWRRFSEDGLRAEIFSMARDGSDVRQLTRLGVMSWAPYYHPSSEYVIFATNLHGFANFELYLVDGWGRREPVRVTDHPGFDGLPVFSPDGARLAWTRGGRGGGGAQVFLAEWSHAEALRRLHLPPGGSGGAGALASARVGSPGAIRAADLQRHVATLSGDDMEGRATGTDGEARATQYVADVFASLGLEPAGDEGSFFQRFSFTSGVSLGGENALWLGSGAGEERFVVDRGWRPLAFSRAGTSGPAPVVFAGYGIVAPAHDEWPAYDAYAGLDVRDRWVMTLRFLPEDVSAEQRQHLSRYSGLRYKAMLARERGALGLIVVAGPRSQVKQPLVPLAMDVALAGTSVYALSLSRAVAGRLLGGRDLELLQRALDGGAPQAGFVAEGVSLTATVNLVRERRVGRNVLARLRRGAAPGLAPVMLGAHVDHLGRGGGGTSLARTDERDRIHPGADDNASGVAALLEIADWLVGSPVPLERDVLFAAWSGEELGLLGSNHWAASLADPNPHAADGDRELAAYLNMDMVGRFDGGLVLHGVGSSSIWRGEIERRNAPVGLAISAQEESYLPTDATPFYLKGVPILSAFTGSHEEYHTPRDTADLLDYESGERIASLMGAIVQSLARRSELPDYIAMQQPGSGPARGSIRVYLGTIPNYARTELSGVALSGVAPNGPADRAGVRAGDVIVGLAGRTVENIYDYTYTLDALKVGEPVELIVIRGGERVVLEIEPESRD